MSAAERSDLLRFTTLTNCNGTGCHVHEETEKGRFEQCSSHRKDEARVGGQKTSPTGNPRTEANAMFPNATQWTRMHSTIP